MQDNERIKLDMYEQKRISIGITENGIRRYSGYIPWENTGHAFNMRTPSIYFEESDFYDPIIRSRLNELEVIGCYIFTPLKNYSFLSDFTLIEDLYIEHGHNIRNLSFAQNMTEWFMCYLEDAEIDNLDDLFLQKKHTTELRPYCFGLTNCSVKDPSAISKSSIRLSELIICCRDCEHEREKWRNLPSLKHKYYSLKP